MKIVRFDVEIVSEIDVKCVQEHSGVSFVKFAASVPSGPLHVTC